MKIIYNKIFLQHDTGNHPENRERLEVFKNLKEKKIESGEKFLSLVHSKNYIQHIKKISQTKKFLDLDTVVSKRSYEVACYAVGAVILASKRGDFALVRPPGHHAGVDHGGGFCFFNNIAIAVKKLIDEDKKVFILDFDGHFGDGTSEIFYNSDRVLYASLHQYPAYPRKGWIDEIGEGGGRGYNVNIPLPPKSGDDLFIPSINYFLSIAEQFKPDIIAVSAGFDGHHSETLLSLNFSVNSYYKVGKIFSGNFKNIFAALEGGYDLNYLPKCVNNFIAGVNKEKIKFKEKETKSNPLVKEEFKKRLKQLKKELSPYWKL